jgi:16S rRNA (cytosine1402-N4)-methyltransferase
VNQEFNHIPVLLKESIDGLNINPAGIYLDCTFGRGGHSQEILKKLNEKGSLIAIDQDLAAIKAAEAIRDKNFQIFHGKFSSMGEILKKKKITKVDGILMDLGVSSPQLDDARRGFSFKADGLLDMRMNQNHLETAADIVNTYDMKDLAYILKVYGEERFARRVARFIVQYREEKTQIKTTRELAQIINNAVPKKEPGKDSATRSFQALRIKVNQEMEEIEKTLPVAFEYLIKNGRLAVISFHSLEDRIVKNFAKEKLQTDLIPKYIPIKASEIQQSSLKRIGKLITPSEKELKNNPRSRSAKLRVIERVAINEA